MRTIHPAAKSNKRPLCFSSNGTLQAQNTASSVCFASTIEMARLIRTKKLSAREALAAHLKQIERVNPTVNEPSCLGNPRHPHDIWIAAL